MERLGLEPQVIQVEGEGWEFEEIGYRGGLRALERGPVRTNTVLCSNDRLAIGFLAACLREGHSRGSSERTAQLRVAGHDDHPSRASPARR